MLGIPQYLWRLLPANPILLRVVGVAGKRKRDLFTRCIYLGLLIGVVLLSIATTGGVGEMSLDKLTGTSEKIFMQMSYLQLFLVALLAPVFTAGAITQEKDSQTYDILLATPLSNGQIVLGSLGSRLFFIVALLVSGIPIFSITKIFGGVAIGDIVTSFAIAVATACVTGALATAIATFKVGTRRTIFSFYMLVVVYLVGIYLLDALPYFHPQLLDPNTQLPSGDASNTSWLAGIHPFLALQTLFAGHRPPEATLLPASLRSWPLEWYFTDPATFFPSFMLALTVLLVLPSMILLRRMAQSSTTVRQSLFRWLPVRALKGGKKPRTVWSNPIAWREARTKVSAARASVLRYGFILLGLGGAVTILIFYESPSTPPANYVQAGSYDRSAGTLHILGEGQTFGVTAGTKVVLDGTEVATDRLFGHYEILNHHTQTRSGVKVLDSIDMASIAGRITRTQAQQFLLGLILVEVSVIVLIVTNAAASTVTREREDGTLDLLLTTPITSRYYLWGKLAGLVSYMVPLTAIPALSALLFVAADCAAYVFGGDIYLQWLVLPEAVILLPLVLLAVVSFSTIVGMQMSLRNRTTVRAVMSSLGIVIGLMAVLGWCGLTAGSSQIAGQMSSAISSFSPLGVIATLIYPEKFGGKSWETGGDDMAASRVVMLIFTLVATAAYAGVVWTMYTSMVKNFDMTIRRQSR